MYHAIFRSVSLSLLTATMLMAELSTADCAKGYDTINGMIKPSAFADPICKTSATNRPKSVSVRTIKNFDQIFDLMKVPKTNRFFRDPLVRKIVDNGYINHYTITIAYYEVQDLFTTSLTDTKLACAPSSAKCGDAYIESVRTGARHLILYHIITHSSRAYHSASHALDKTIGNIEELEEILSHLAQKYEIRIKEYFTPGIDAVTTSELQESFQQPRYFDRLVATDAIPYRYIIRSYPNMSDENISKRREMIKNRIHAVLNGYMRYNDYRYYRRASEEFRPLDQAAKRKLCEDAESLSGLLQKSSKRGMDREVCDAIENVTLSIPGRYTAALPDQDHIRITPQQIDLAIKNFAGKISPETSIQLTLQSRLDLQNHGKILRLSNLLSIQKQGKRYHATNKRILFDTYVDYPGLRFEAIQNSYGELSASFPFDRYIQKRESKGRGIIDSAQCGYRLDTNGTLHASCKIKFKPVDIQFRHVENDKN